MAKIIIMEGDKTILPITRPFSIFDDSGNEYRIKVLKEGLEINKPDGTIKIEPHVSNEIIVK